MAENQNLNNDKKKTVTSRKKSRKHIQDKNSSPVSTKKPKLSELKTNNKKGSEFLFKLRKTCQSHHSNSILQYYRRSELGWPCQEYKRPIRNSLINYCKTFKLYKMETLFDRRVTFLIWHPKNPNLLAVTSHGGDLVLCNYKQEFNTTSLIKGIGAGGSVQSMKFDPLNSEQIYTASMEGKFLVFNFETKKQICFLETNNLNRWYVSLDVNSHNNVMVAGDTCGNITVLTLDGQVIDTIQIHKKGFKVSHTEFSKRESWLLCTSSTDKTLKFWDIRYLKKAALGEMVEPVQTIQQIKPINAAYFSLTDGCRLLTTDQMDKIYIYRAPLWDIETVIDHPHRQFQHLTPIKAYWHPLEDIIFVGRYPYINFPGYHSNELRTIDFFDAETGDLLHQHYQSGIDAIMSLNRFNITGDALASSYGCRFLIWKPNFKHLEKMSKKTDHFETKRKNRGGDDKYDDDDSDDDNDDNDGNHSGEAANTHSTPDWKAIMKKQDKEKRQSRSKKTDSKPN